MRGESSSGDPSPDKAGRNQDGTFAKGRSGNLKGKPVGVRSRATLMVDAILFKNMKDITEKLVTAAKAGEHWAVTLALKDQLPGRSGTPFELPKLESAADLPAASKSILEQMAAGALTATEGAQILAALESHGRVATLAGHEERLAAVEALLAENSKRNGED
jgi:hypothetical protein